MGSLLKTALSQNPDKSLLEEIRASKLRIF